VDEEPVDHPMMGGSSRTLAFGRAIEGRRPVLPAFWVFATCSNLRALVPADKLGRSRGESTWPVRLQEVG
jgi:hypothetical protein